MKVNRAILSGFILWVSILSGCGFGGFTDNPNNDAASANQSKTDTDTKITGVVAKGLFKDGTVRVYALNTDGTETLLRTSKINAFGNYSSRISAFKTSTTGSYNGIYLIKATGSYLDESTGSVLTIDEGNPLRAVIANPSGIFTASVTPLTELAARKVLALQQGGKSLASTDVTAANALISEMFKVDIIGTKPVEPDQTPAGIKADTGQGQRDYTLALAAISQMAKADAGALAGTLNALSGDIADGAMSVESAGAFQSALTAFLGSDKNATGITSINNTNLANAGGTTKTIKIATSAKEGANALIRGITVTLVLPPGVTLRANFVTSKEKKEPLSAVVTLPSTMSANTQFQSAYSPPASGARGMVTISLGNAYGFAAGEFLMIKCDVAPGAVPVTSDFTIYRNPDNPEDPKNFQAVDGNGALFPPEVLSAEIMPE
ncbi:lipoprotein, putative [Geotalea daltonii FRC-32]|uniref:Lipoprotein, putative n=1 Tax=Geotalea daltonii (strain DSM 22248 / JCM 15807 / FRC-32) TaxID=316067 RepID=B9M6U0_GEODF|nr:hypothetical protein [Geotalea daltonii]ACM20150.1 lipoprotein, putative [Geotalea daltonii FRC-32]